MHLLQNTHLNISSLTAPSTGQTDAEIWLAQAANAALTCQEVLNGSDQRLSVSWSDHISLRLCEEHRKSLFHYQTQFRGSDRYGFSLTPMSTSASALASSVCGRWRFISSPSKSALYGVQTHSLKRNVRWGFTRAWNRIQENYTRALDSFSFPFQFVWI